MLKTWFESTATHHRVQDARY